MTQHNKPPCGKNEKTLPSARTLTRRDFVKGVAGASASALLLQACNLTTATAPRKATPARAPKLRPQKLRIGDNGTILTGDFYCEKWRIVPETKMREFWPNRPPKTIPRSPGNMEEFILACKGAGPAPGANFDYAAHLSEIVHLGNLAIRAAQPIKWDHKKMKVANVPEANQYVRREPRQGWKS